MGRSAIFHARARAVLPGSGRLVTRTPVGRIALTFDDGPDPVGTPAMLEALAGCKVVATFFLLSDRARPRPELVKRIVDAGHEVALHGDRHERMDRVQPRPLAGRLSAAARELEDMTGQPVTSWRPPFGRLSLWGLRAAAAAGLRAVLWTHDARDYSEEETIARDIGSMFVSGAVVLLHDGAGAVQAMRTADAVRASSCLIRDRGLEPCRVRDIP